MKYTGFIVLVAVLFLSPDYPITEAQNTYLEERYNIQGLDYIDFIYTHNRLWAISQDGQLVIWNIKTNELGAKQYHLERLTWIDKTWYNDIYIGTRDGHILKFNNIEKSWEVIFLVSYPVYGVCIIDESTQYAVTEHGVVNLVSKALYRPQYSINSQLDDRTKKPFGKPSVIFCDSRQNIWIGYDKGEWGGDIQIFSTIAKAYLPIKINVEDFIYGTLRVPIIEVLPITSIFEGTDHTVYITSGLQHFHTHGAILQFHEIPSGKTIDTKEPKNITLSTYVGSSVFISFPTKESRDGDYIGPGYWNPYNQKVYFYSEHGFQWIERYSEGEEIIRHAFFQPKLTWKIGRENAMGYSMNVLKFEFIDERTMVFLTKFDGIGIFDSHTIKFYK